MLFNREYRLTFVRLYGGLYRSELVLEVLRQLGQSLQELVDHPGSQCCLDRTILSVPLFTIHRPFENLSLARLWINGPTKSAGHCDSQPLKYFLARPVQSPEVIFPLAVPPKLVLGIEFGDNVALNLMRLLNPRLTVLF